MTRVEEVAYHEAGHVVCALAMGFEVVSVSLRKGPRRGAFPTNGRVHVVPKVLAPVYSWNRTRTKAGLAFQAVVVCCGGAAATARAILTLEVGAGCLGDSEDSDLIMNGLNLSQQDRDLFLGRAARRALTIIHSRFWSVEAIAAALLVSPRKRMVGKEIARVVRNARAAKTKGA